MVKVERSYPPPSSLAQEAQKQNGTYNCTDVVERLVQDFHNKCYLCEISPVQDPNIEHRLSHKNGKYPERKFDWDNLFWSCGHCNNVKKNAKYDAGILDCCKVDPEEKLSFSLRGGEPVIAALSRDDTTELTAELLNEVYNKTNTGMRVYKCKVRTDALNEEMNVFFKELAQYQKEHKPFTFRTLKALLDRKSPFAAFKRAYIRQNDSKYPELCKLLN